MGPSGERRWRRVYPWSAGRPATCRSSSIAVATGHSFQWGTCRRYVVQSKRWPGTLRSANVWDVPLRLVLKRVRRGTRRRHASSRSSRTCCHTAENTLEKPSSSSSSTATVRTRRSAGRLTPKRHLTRRLSRADQRERTRSVRRLRTCVQTCSATVSTVVFRPASAGHGCRDRRNRAPPGTPKESPRVGRCRPAWSPGRGARREPLPRLGSHGCAGDSRRQLVGLELMQRVEMSARRRPQT